MTTRKKLILFGTGSTAEVMHHRLTQGGGPEVAAFSVDADYLTEVVKAGLPVVPFETLPDRFPPDAFDLMIAVGYAGVNRFRAERFAQARTWGYHMPAHVGPGAQVWDGCRPGENCRIGANTLIQPFAAIGENTSIGSGSIVGHHTRIGDHVFIGSGVTLGGNVVIGDYAFLGTGAVVRNKIVIAPGTVIGAGSVILEDTEPGGVYLSRTADRLPVQSKDLPLR